VWNSTFSTSRNRVIALKSSMLMDTDAIFALFGLGEAANLQEISVHVSVFSKCHMRDPWFFGDWRWLPEVDLSLVPIIYKAR
jgi:hypothetical protein